MKLFYDAFNVPSHLSPIIFLHGLGDWRHTWRKVAPEIAKRTRRQAYVLDARNHGDNPRETEFNYEVLTQDLVDFVDDLGIASAIIVGHSMGGRTAINFALKHPGRTEALVVEDMTPRNVYSGSGTFMFEAISAADDLLKSIPPEQSLENVKKYLLDFLISFAGERFIDEERARKMVDVDLVPIKRVGDSFTVAADVEDIKSMLKRDSLVQNLSESGLVYTGPSLFMYGSKPFFNLGKDATIKKLFPKAEVRKIEGSTHYIHVDNSELFVQTVADFILGRDSPLSKM